METHKLERRGDTHAIMFTLLGLCDPLQYLQVELDFWFENDKHHNLSNKFIVTKKLEELETHKCDPHSNWL